jgi:hypothetical protein
MKIAETIYTPFLKKVHFDLSWPCYVPCCVAVNTHTIVNWKKICEMLLTTLAHNQHDVIDVIWRLSVWNVMIMCFLASCMLQFWSNLTKASFQGKHFNYLLFNAYSVTSGLILIFKMYDLVILFIIQTFKISYIFFFFMNNPW